MTPYGEPRVWLDHFRQGEPADFHCGHLGIQYPGEVIRALSWSPAWGEALTGDTFFRIVLLGQRRGSQVPAVNDPRIAVCLPASVLTRRRNDLTKELATIRETHAMYPVLTDSDADLIRTTLRRRQEGLEDDLMGEESVRYSQGTIITGPANGSNQAPEPGTIFASVEPTAWFTRLSEWLLNRAYPSLPVEQQALSRPITGEDAADLYRAIFGQPGARPEIMREAGPALGLSSPSNPDIFLPSGCPGFALLEEWLQQQPAEANFQDAYRHLSHEVGLTGPLALLTLLLFLRFQEPEFEISLSSTGNLSLLDGSPLLAGRLTKDLLPLLPWDPGIAQLARGIGPITDPAWQNSLHHLSYLIPGLTGEGTGESALIAGLEALSQDLSVARRLLAQFHQATREDESQQLTGSLDRLFAIVGEASNGYQAVYHRMRSLYPDPRSVAEDIAQARQIVELETIAEDLLGALHYLEGAAVPDADAPDLSVERQALQAALSFRNLAQPGGRPWNLWAQEVAKFKEGYSALYRTHHQDMQRALPQYREDLASARRKVTALNLLDQLQELGDSGNLADLDFTQALDQLNDELQLCQVPAEDLDLETLPTCDSCQLSLERRVPVQELAGLINRIDTGLGAKNRLLSGLLVGKIMEDAVDPRLDDFLSIVQASDLSALSDTLNEDLLAFIRRVLV